MTSVEILAEMAEHREIHYLSTQTCPSPRGGVGVPRGLAVVKMGHV